MSLRPYSPVTPYTGGVHIYLGGTVVVNEFGLQAEALCGRLVPGKALAEGIEQVDCMECLELIHLAARHILPSDFAVPRQRRS